jgi:hypothetical protein
LQEVFKRGVGYVEDEPIVAGLFFLSTLTHSTTAAPELSMQLSIVCDGELLDKKSFYNIRRV